MDLLMKICYCLYIMYSKPSKRIGKANSSRTFCGIVTSIRKRRFTGPHSRRFFSYRWRWFRWVPEAFNDGPNCSGWTQYIQEVNKHNLDVSTRSNLLDLISEGWNLSIPPLHHPQVLYMHKLIGVTSIRPLLRWWNMLIGKGPNRGHR